MRYVGCDDGSSGQTSVWCRRDDKQCVTGTMELLIMEPEPKVLEILRHIQKGDSLAKILRNVERHKKQTAVMCSCGNLQASSTLR